MQVRGESEQLLVRSPAFPGLSPSVTQNLTTEAVQVLESMDIKDSDESIRGLLGTFRRHAIAEEFACVFISNIVGAEHNRTLAFDKLLGPTLPMGGFKYLGCLKYVWNQTQARGKETGVVEQARVVDVEEGVPSEDSSDDVEMCTGESDDEETLAHTQKQQKEEEDAFQSLTAEQEGEEEGEDLTPPDQNKSGESAVTRSFKKLAVSTAGDMLDILTNHSGASSLLSAHIATKVAPASALVLEIPPPNPFAPCGPSEAHVSPANTAATAALILKGTSAVAEQTLRNIMKSPEVRGDTDLQSLWGFVLRKDSARRASLLQLVGAMYRVYGGMMVLSVLFNPKNITAATELYFNAEMKFRRSIFMQSMMLVFVAKQNLDPEIKTRLVDKVGTAVDNLAQKVHEAWNTAFVTLQYMKDKTEKGAMERRHVEATELNKQATPCGGNRRH